MKKLFLLLLLVSLVTFLFVGCLPVTPSEGEGEGEGEMDVIINGDFETCDFTGWTVTTDSSFPQIFYTDDCVAYMGDGASGLSEGGITNTASIQQTFYIPADAVNPLLKLYYYVVGTDSDGEGYDWMKVDINNSEILYVWSDSVGWQLFQCDLSAYTGTFIDLKIKAWTDDSISSVDYYVDGITVTWD